VGAPDAAEAGRFAGYAVLGGFGLKFVQLVFRRFDKKRTDEADAIKLTLEAGEDLRDELRKENEDLRQRNVSLVERANALEDKCRTCSVTMKKLADENEDLRAELRMWKRGARTPDGRS
jgi:FtsZ-binding cell division protein ZapB